MLLKDECKALAHPNNPYKLLFMNKPYLYFIILGICFACQPSSNNQNGEKQSEQGMIDDSEKAKKEIKASLVDMWDAIEHEDLERYASYIHPDFTQFGEYDSILREGKAAEIKGISSWIEEASDIHTEMLDPQVTVMDNVGWIVYYWKDHGITEKGSFSTRGKSTRIFVKENEKWLCIHGHYTLLP